MRLPGGSLFSPPEPKLDIPFAAIPEPAVAPVPDDKAIKRRKRRRFSEARQRSGRLSTINTEPQGTVLG